MSSDWILLLGLACLIVAVLIMLGAWALDLFRATDTAHEDQREWYKQAIRDEINEIAEGRVLDSEYLNELLEDYWRARRS